MPLPDILEVKAVIRGLLISNPTEVSVAKLRHDFSQQEGYEIPFIQWGYHSLLEFLKTIPDVCTIEHNGRFTVVKPVLTRKTAHIDSLVTRQKLTTKAIGVRKRRSGRPPRMFGPPMGHREPYPSTMDINFRSYQQPSYPRVTPGQSVTSSRSSDTFYSCASSSVGDSGRTSTPLNTQSKPFRGRVDGLDEDNDEEDFYTDFDDEDDHDDEYERCFSVNKQSADVNEEIPESVCYFVRQILRENSQGLTLQSLVQKLEFSVKEHSSQYTLPKNISDLIKTLPKVKVVDNVAYLDEYKEAEVHAANDADLSEERNDEPVEGSEKDASENTLVEEDTEYESPVLQNLKLLLRNSKGSGILLSEIGVRYKNRFGVPLNLQRSLGFVDIEALATNMPNMFRIGASGNGTRSLYLAEDDEKLESGTDGKQVTANSVVKGNLINLLKLIPDGIKVSQLFDFYNEYFEGNMNFDQLGFPTLQMFCEGLEKEGVVSLRHCSGELWICYNASDDVDDLFFSEDDSEDKHQEEKGGQVGSLGRGKAANHQKQVEELKPLFPPDVVGPDFKVQEMELPPNAVPGEHIEVYVTEVVTPHNFFITFRHHNPVVEKLMDDLQAFYCLHYHSYKMPTKAVIDGIICVTKFNNEWHRARVTNEVNKDEVMVLFFDYGTAWQVSKIEIFFLRKEFSELPCLSLKAVLYNIEPVDISWSWEAGQRFLTLVRGQALVAYVAAVDKMNTVLSLVLCDTSGDDDIYINDLLVDEGYAKFVEIEVCSQQEEHGEVNGNNALSLGVEAPCLEGISNDQEALIQLATQASQPDEVTEVPLFSSIPVLTDATTHDSNGKTDDSLYGTPPETPEIVQETAITDPSIPQPLESLVDKGFAEVSSVAEVLKDIKSNDLSPSPPIYSDTEDMAPPRPPPPPGFAPITVPKDCSSDVKIASTYATLHQNRTSRPSSAGIEEIRTSSPIDYTGMPTGAGFWPHGRCDAQNVRVPNVHAPVYTPRAPQPGAWGYTTQMPFVQNYVQNPMQQSYPAWLHPYSRPNTIVQPEHVTMDLFTFLFFQRFGRLPYWTEMQQYVGVPALPPPGLHPLQGPPVPMSPWGVPQQRTYVEPDGVGSVNFIPPNASGIGRPCPPPVYSKPAAPVQLSSIPTHDKPSLCSISVQTEEHSVEDQYGISLEKTSEQSVKEHALDNNNVKSEQPDQCSKEVVSSVSDGNAECSVPSHEKPVEADHENEAVGEGEKSKNMHNVDKVLLESPVPANLPLEQAETSQTLSPESLTEDGTAAPATKTKEVDETTLIKSEQEEAKSKHVQSTKLKSTPISGSGGIMLFDVPKSEDKTKSQQDPKRTEIGKSIDNREEPVSTRSFNLEAGNIDMKAKKQIVSTSNTETGNQISQSHSSKINSLNLETGNVDTKAKEQKVPTSSTESGNQISQSHSSKVNSLSLEAGNIDTKAKKQKMPTSSTESGNQISQSHSSKVNSLSLEAGNSDTKTKMQKVPTSSTESGNQISQSHSSKVNSLNLEAGNIDTKDKKHLPTSGTESGNQISHSHSSKTMSKSTSLKSDTKAEIKVPVKTLGDKFAELNISKKVAEIKAKCQDSKDKVDQWLEKKDDPIVVRASERVKKIVQHDPTDDPGFPFQKIRATSRLASSSWRGGSNKPTLRCSPSLMTTSPSKRAEQPEDSQPDVSEDPANSCNRTAKTTKSTSQWVSNIVLDNKSVHLIDLDDNPYVLTDEIIKKFSHFNGYHVAAKILDALCCNISSFEVNRDLRPDLFEDLDRSDIWIGQPKNNVNIMPLRCVRNLLTSLNVNNYTLFEDAKIQHLQFMDAKRLSKS